MSAFMLAHLAVATRAEFASKFVAGRMISQSRFLASLARDKACAEGKVPRPGRGTTKGTEPRDDAMALRTDGPEPSYDKVNCGYQRFTYEQPFPLDVAGNTLNSFTLAYETWGKLDAGKSNAILLHTGLSASSHACSHDQNRSEGWWEKFIGPGKALDTDKYFIICSNVLGGCYGSTGPSSIDASTGQPFADDFPLITIPDMVRAQFLLLDTLGIDRLHASVGSSMGGMQSLQAAASEPDRVGRMISISAAGRSHPQSIAFRFVQRRVLMADPEWSSGKYYGKTFPRVGMKHAREIGTISYRSGPEWESRFGRRRSRPDEVPSLSPDYLIEEYLDHQGDRFATTYDPNSLLFISKAMDLFDLGDGQESYAAGVSRVRCPCLIIGVKSDVLFPVWQQREVAALLRTGGAATTFYELDSLYGHDTFLIDVDTVGTAVKGFLDTSMKKMQE